MCSGSEHQWFERLPGLLDKHEAPSATFHGRWTFGRHLHRLGLPPTLNVHYKQYCESVVISPIKLVLCASAMCVGIDIYGHRKWRPLPAQR